MNRPPGSSAPDYLIVGHITQDLVNGGSRLGGTAVYSSVLARRFGLDVALYTSFAPDLDLDILDGIHIHNQGGVGTTTFRNIYTPSGRIQHILSRADDLDLGRVPVHFRQARIIHLAPVAREIRIDGGEEFPDGELVYSLQGWLREWEPEGLVHPAPLPALDPGSRLGGTAFLSIEDLGFDRQKLEPILDAFQRLVLTTGDQGAELYLGDKMQSVPAVPAGEVDPTGAGDIFAAAFIIARVMMNKDPQQAASLANALAAISVTRTGIEGIPTAKEITEVEKVY